MLEKNNNNFYLLKCIAIPVINPISFYIKLITIIFRICDKLPFQLFIYFYKTQFPLKTVLLHS